MRRLRRSSGAAAHVYGLLVAGIAFLALVALLLLNAARPATDRSITNPNREAGQDLDAALLADILASPGQGWEGGADAVRRLGLGADNGSGLDPARLAALRGALLSSSAANGKVDYPDARASLGLPGVEDFNLSVERLGPPTPPPGPSFPHTAYVGDWSSLATTTVLPGSSQAMRSSAQTAIDDGMMDAAASEREALTQLGLDFEDRVFISAVSPTVLVDMPAPLPDVPLLTSLNVPLIEGDVYPDIKSYLDANLPGRLAPYEVLVVGSGVDHSALTSSGTKGAIAQWVQGGGRLVVLGSDAQNAQWLQPLFAVGTVSVGGPVTAPDPADRLLNVPFPLAWQTYDTHGLAWDIQASGANQHHGDFHHTLVQDGSDVLAWSKAGAFGAGSVVLSSIRPHELSDIEQVFFFLNLLNPTEATSYDLSYGPEPPPGAAVSAVQRTTYVVDPGQGLVQLRVTLRVWNAP